MALDNPSVQAATLIEALPYIRAHRGQTVVVKVGGAALSEPAHALSVAEDLALMAMVGMRLVVIHGGGPQVSEEMERRGIKARFVGGMRVTDQTAAVLVQEILTGVITPHLVADLSAAGLAAVGLSGTDGKLLSATRLLSSEGQDLGHVGEVAGVDGVLLESLIDAGYTPVVAPLATADDGALLNINADVAAAAIAIELAAAKLVYLTDVEGLYRDFGDRGSLLSELKADDLAALIPDLSDGMKPKAASALKALRGGVGKVHILDGRVKHALLLEVFTDDGSGTQVLP
jgi:acetylglutamate kinase